MDHRSFDHQLAHQELNLNDSTITNQGSAFYVTYGRLIGDNQFAFDRNLRIALGLDPDGNDFINLDALDPTTSPSI